MATYWTRPQPVEATQWHPSLGTSGVFAEATPMGCAICGPGFGSTGFYNACVNPAEHDPFRHPHHLLIGTPQGREAVFDGYWLVVFPDGKRQVCAPNDFAVRFITEDVVWYGTAPVQEGV